MKMKIECTFNYFSVTTIWAMVLAILVIYNSKADQALLNCAEIRDGIIPNSGAPKTKEEQIVQLESQYFNQLSKFSPCSIDDNSLGTSDNLDPTLLYGSTINGVDTKNQPSTDKIDELERINQQKAKDDIKSVKSISTNLKANDFGSLSIDSEGYYQLCIIIY